MNGFMDLTSLIFLVIAIAVFWRLRSVLGSRTGNERPPVDPYSKRDEQVASNNDNVVTLPSARRREGDVPAEANQHIDAVAPEGTALNNALKTILSADSSFDPDYFLEGAKAAYEMIVTAYAKGDRGELKSLLSTEVFTSFASAIGEREKQGQKMDFTFVGVDKAEIIEAMLKDGDAQVTVRFVSQLISATYDANGALIDGEPSKVAEVTDIWTFARPVRARDPNWKLVATEADG